MNGDFLGISAGLPAVLSIFLEWFPGVSKWWASLSSQQRRLTNAALVVALNSIALLLVCNGVWETSIVSCPEVGFVDWFVSVFVGLLSSFATHANIKKSSP